MASRKGKLSLCGDHVQRYFQVTRSFTQSDLPDYEERRNIFEIHLRKRGKLSKAVDTIELLKKTFRVSGADIEAVVKEAIESAFFTDENAVTMNHILDTIKLTKSISVTLK